ncbi:efflux RND transporter periplasmic adaptor subunit [Verrucomicrobiaceae bacterium 227]
MKVPVFSLITIAAVVGVTFVGVKVLKMTAPEAEKKDLVTKVPVVEVLTAERHDLDFPLESEGVVTTRRETILSAEVGGKIVKVHPLFEVGATFQVGEVIAEIDQVNYVAAVAQARSTVADASLALKQEQARGEQAVRDWAKIGRGKEASEMVLRVPYLESAEAKLEAAGAMLNKALEDLDRTLIKAPFDCRVRDVTLNLGATVAPGTRLGMIYDPDKMLVRLPFTMDDFAQIPKESRIDLSADISGEWHHWEAAVLWDGGEIDRATLSAYLLAEVKPAENAPERFRLPPPGLFVKAKLTGSKLPGVIAVPRKAVRGRNTIAVLNSENELEFRTLRMARSNSEFLYVTSGIEAGEKVILTKLEIPLEGMKLDAAVPEKETEVPTP